MFTNRILLISVSYTGHGLKSPLYKRADYTMTFNMAVTTQDCGKEWIMLELLNSGGGSDGWTPNDWYFIRIPQMVCAGGNGGERLGISHFQFPTLLISLRG